MPEGENEIEVPAPLRPCVIAVLTGVACFVVTTVGLSLAVAGGVLVVGIALTVVDARRWSREHIAEPFAQARNEGRPRPYVRYTWRA